MTHDERADHPVRAEGVDGFDEANVDAIIDEHRSKLGLGVTVSAKGELVRLGNELRQPRQVGRTRRVEPHDETERFEIVGKRRGRPHASPVRLDGVGAGTRQVRGRWRQAVEDARPCDGRPVGRVGGHANTADVGQRRRHLGDLCTRVVDEHHRRRSEIELVCHCFDPERLRFPTHPPRGEVLASQLHFGPGEPVPRVVLVVLAGQREQEPGSAKIEQVPLERPERRARTNVIEIDAVRSVLPHHATPQGVVCVEHRDLGGPALRQSNQPGHPIGNQREPRLRIRHTRERHPTVVEHCSGAEFSYCVVGIGHEYSGHRGHPSAKCFAHAVRDRHDTMNVSRIANAERHDVDDCRKHDHDRGPSGTGPRNNLLAQACKAFEDQCRVAVDERCRSSAERVFQPCPYHQHVNVGVGQNRWVEQALLDLIERPDLDRHINAVVAERRAEIGRNGVRGERCEHGNSQNRRILL